MSSANQQPVIIVGGGPVGLVTAIAMQQQGLPVKVLEAKKQGASHQDKRALALSFGSRNILEKLGVWAAIEAKATAINTIHVSQRGSMGRTKLEAEEHDLPALGYVVAYGTLMQALDGAIDAKNIIDQAPVSAVRQDLGQAEVDFTSADELTSLVSPLVIIAEGGRSLANVPGLQRDAKAYGHDALVSKVSCERSHDHIAYERFTQTGPMALLPNGKRDFSLVWTGEQSSIDHLLTLDDATFLTELHTAFGDRVGRFLSVQKRLSFPLLKSQLTSNNTPHVVVIGNSAQTMHPVAGQGFNVGLRDADALVGQLATSMPAEWGSQAMLEAYAATRKRDTKGGLLFTDFLVNTFSNDVIGLSGLRSTGLGLLDVFQPAKNFLVNKMSYGK